MALTPEQIEVTKALVSSIWTPSIANSLNYNEEVEEVVRLATQQIGQCSAYIYNLFAALTLGAVGGAAVIYSKQWMRDLGLDVAKAVADNKNNFQARACINTAAASYRSPLEMASLGI
ncbi:hypothetical protein [Stutzerimonas nitrititolerans]|uniref:hypothetical protein n=1 Tax=Stutzerimonas nitrititolerans TaxID=2482751 RepID=UPI0028A7B582|nr:hypothetical protein [Stutzerimonas nitrititolerans]